MNKKSQFASWRWFLPLLMGAFLPAGISPGPAFAADPGFLSNLGLLDRLTRGAVAAAVDSLDLPAGEQVTILSRTFHEANWFVGGKMAEELARRGHPVRLLEWSTGTGAQSGQAPALQGEKAPGSKALPDGEGPPVNGRSLPEELYGEEAQAYADSVSAYADSVAAASYDPLWGEIIDDGEPEAPPRQVEPPRREVPRPGDSGRPLPSAPPTDEPRVDSHLLPEGHVLDVRVIEFGVQYSDVGRRLLFGPMQFTRVGGVFLQTSYHRDRDGTITAMTSTERHQVDRLSGSQRHLAEGASYPFSKPVLQAPSLGRYVEPAVVVGIVGSLVYLFYANQN